MTNPVPRELEPVLAPGALGLVARLQRELGARRLKLLGQRPERQLRLDAGEPPNFLPDPAAVRATGMNDSLSGGEAHDTNP